MPDFKGFDDWVEIFTGGKQVDSSGREHDGDALIDKAVANFNADRHEPPLVIGHPADNAPAYGWVAELRAAAKNGAKVLLAKFRQVEPSFEDLAKAGRYKKRSAAFYPDGSLRHVGFLGAAPPAVKGLADVAFAESGSTFEFSESDGAIARIFRRLREWLIEKEGADTADRIVGDWEINDIQRQAETETETPAAQLFTEHHKEEQMPEKNFTEADLATAVAKGKEEAKAALLAEFAEKEKARRAKEHREQAIAFCEAGVAAGTILPAWVKGGLPEFMGRLDGEEQIAFAEGGAQISQQTWFKAFLEQLPKMVKFEEIATRDGDLGDHGAAAAKLEQLTAAKMKANPKLTYGAAFAEVQAENVELAQSYQQSLQPE